MQRTPSAIVTGAGSGIGRAIAQQLALAGYRLTIAGRRRAALEETLHTCRGSAEIRPVSCDVSVADQVESLIDEHVRHFGGLDVLVNNAGIGEVHPLGTIARDDITAAMMTNACSAGWAIARAWPTWVRQQHGCIINIASMAVFDPFPGFFGYAASKAALAMMAVSAAKEGTPHNIRAFAICPGAVETQMLRASFSLEVIPANQCLHPDEVANVVMECVRMERDQENGRAIAVVSPSADAWLNEHRTTPGLWLR
jgi:NAD(P)-dependent dehydrogenase (short-subunit alcohol dehydrogenase family)